MNVPEYLVAVQFRLGDDSDGIEVVDLLKSLVLGDHLLVDAVEML